MFSRWGRYRGKGALFYGLPRKLLVFVMYQYPELKGRISNLKCHNQGTRREYWSYDIYINDTLVWHEDYAVGTREQVIEAAIKLGNVKKHNLWKKMYFQEIDNQRRNIEIFREKEFPAIAQTFDLPKYQQVILFDGMPYHYGSDGYDPFYCDLPVCENGDYIEVGGKYRIPIYGVVEVTKITRSTTFHYFVAIDEDGEEVHDLKIGEFIKRV